VSERRVNISFDHYYRYEELTDLVHAYAEKYPEFVSVESAGKSHEERDIWAVTVTNRETGEPGDKPAMYVDGNIHAGEVTGSVTCMYLIDFLVTNYESNVKVKKLLDTRTFYVLPRVNPDGAEKYLTTPTLLRSSVRIYPDIRKDEDPPGLHAEDINDDGKILLMRIRDDDHGAWKVAPDDRRIMMPRSPVDLEGPFYHIVSEGYLKDEDGELVEEAEWPFDVVPVPYGLDLNRNFPAGYSPLTSGAGPFPLSEPETRTQVEFIDKHRNIGGVILFHTTGGVLFRPHSTIPDSDFEKEDIKLYKQIGKLGTDVTGYPVVCCYGDIWSGVLDDWAFEHRGIFGFTPELWDVVGRAAPEYKSDELRRFFSEDERNELERKIFTWNDRELAGKGFIDWHEFDHPQFGTVEIGGWDFKNVRQNPPVKFLEQECHKNSQFVLDFGMALPEVHIDDVNVKPAGNGAYVVSALVSNHGFLSTNISKQAEKVKAVEEDRLELELGENVTLVRGTRRRTIGFLQGYHAGQNMRFYAYGPPAQAHHRENWTVVVSGGGPHEVTVALKSSRGGVVKKTVTLG